MNPSAASGGMISSPSALEKSQWMTPNRSAVDQGRHEHRVAAAQRAVEEAAEEELLRHGRDADDHEAGGDQAERALVGAQVLRPPSARRRAGRSPCRAPRGRRSSPCPSAAQPTVGQKRRAAQAEVLGPRLAGEGREQHGGADEDHALEERGHDREGRRRLVGRLAPVAAATMPTTTSVSDQRDEEADPGVPRRPARRRRPREAPGARAAAALDRSRRCSTDQSE